MRKLFTYVLPCDRLYFMLVSLFQGLGKAFYANLFRRSDILMVNFTKGLYFHLLLSDGESQE